MRSSSTAKKSAPENEAVRTLRAIKKFIIPLAPPVFALEKSIRATPFKILISVLLSSRTKDAVTEKASARLFAAAGTPGKMALLSEAEIARLIYPVGFYRTKARHLRETAALLLERHDGRVPQSMDELLELPGVGRKTANLVRNLGYGLPGICVDTHVHRISNRLGWVRTASPEQTEKALEQVLPRRYWIEVNELLVGFGQRLCTPLSPKCSACPIRGWCPRIGVGRSR